MAAFAATSSTQVADPFKHDRDEPVFWRYGDFFIVMAGRWREHGYCFGRLRFPWRYSKWLMGRIKAAEYEVRTKC
jgi:hypothetical protein